MFRLLVCGTYKTPRFRLNLREGVGQESDLFSLVNRFLSVDSAGGPFFDETGVADRHTGQGRVCGSVDPTVIRERHSRQNT